MASQHRRGRSPPDAIAAGPAKTGRLNHNSGDPANSIPTARAKAPERGILGGQSEAAWVFAAYDSRAHHIEPGVHATRFSAFLAPFGTREAAVDALIAAGVAQVEDGR